MIIAGTRTFQDYSLLKERCDYYLQNVNVKEIVSGCAYGADLLGENYAEEYGYLIHQFPANWTVNGVAAGPIRNRQMAKHADLLIAFWDGKSKGTKNMIEEAKKHNLKIRVVRF